MAFHRIVFPRPVLDAVLQGEVTCALRPALVVVAGDELLAALDGQPPLARLKVTGFRRGVPLLELPRRVLERAGLAEWQRRAEFAATIGAGTNPVVNVIHFRLMRR